MKKGKSSTGFRTLAEQGPSISLRSCPCFITRVHKQSAYVSVSIKKPDFKKKEKWDKPSVQLCASQMDTEPDVLVI